MKDESSVEGKTITMPLAAALFYRGFIGGLLDTPLTHRLGPSQIQILRNLREALRGESGP